MANPRDIEALIKLDGELGYISSRDKAMKMTAKALGLSVDAVRVMSSRARTTIEGQVALIDYETRTPDVNPSRRNINKLVSDGKSRVNAFKETLQDTRYYAVFLSDIHFPAHDSRALTIMYNIVKDLPNVAFTSALNDVFDFPKVSHWEDRRRIRKQVYDDDIENTLKAHDRHMKIMQMVAPSALHVAVVGNHDKRVTTHDKHSGLVDKRHLGILQRLTDSGVTFESDMSYENVFKLNDGLFWYHGKPVSANRKSAGIKTYDLVKRLTKHRSDFTLISGHMHDAHDIKIPNTLGRHVLSGCLCKMEQHYMTTPANWVHGFVVSEFDPHSAWHHTQLVTMQDDNGELSAYFNGNKYTAKR